MKILYFFTILIYFSEGTDNGGEGLEHQLDRNKLSTILQHPKRCGGAFRLQQYFSLKFRISNKIPGHHRYSERHLL